MSKIIFVVSAVICAIGVFGLVNDNSSESLKTASQFCDRNMGINSSDWLDCSATVIQKYEKNQNNATWITIISGIVAFFSGLIAFGSNDNNGNKTQNERNHNGQK